MLLAASAAPPGHLASSGVAIGGGGFASVTALWVTPGVVDHAYYHALVPAEHRAWQRAAAQAFTLIRLDVENHSDLTLEGYLALNLRLSAGGVLHPVVGGATALAPHSRLVPDLGRQVLPPRTRFGALYAFPRVPRSTREVGLVIRPLWAFARGVGQVESLPEFVLRFDPAALTYPPDDP